MTQRRTSAAVRVESTGQRGKEEADPEVWLQENDDEDEDEDEDEDSPQQTKRRRRRRRVQ